MFIHDLIDEKIYALTNMKGMDLDETDGEDMFLYWEMREFAEKNGGLLFFIEDEYYLVLNIIDEDDFLIIPTEYSMRY